MTVTPHQFFSLLSDETRLRCLLLMHEEKELCVCELSCVLMSIQPKISRHLSLLRKSGLALDERRGQWVYYRLNDKLEPWMTQVLKASFAHLKKSEPYRGDVARLKKERKGNPCSSKGGC